MPAMDGVELARRARELRPDLPVVFMSGYSDLTTGEHPVPRPDLPVGPTVQKPFTAVELAGAVRQALDAIRGGARRDPGAR